MSLVFVIVDHLAWHTLLTVKMASFGTDDIVLGLKVVSTVSAGIYTGIMTLDYIANAILWPIFPGVVYFIWSSQQALIR